MTVNRECAEMALLKVAAAADGTKGGKASMEAGATVAVAYALLDVADAIREQTAAEYERQAIIPHEASRA